MKLFYFLIVLILSRMPFFLDFLNDDTFLVNFFFQNFHKLSKIGIMFEKVK